MESGRGNVWRVDVGVYGEGACGCMEKGRVGVWRGREGGGGGIESGRGGVWRVGEGVYGEWA